MANNEIKALFLDVDGVIVGSQQGFNAPEPHPKVIEALKRVHERGIPVILCTARPCFAVASIVTAARLDNLHITSSGSLVSNLMTGEVQSLHPLDSQFAQQIVRTYLQAGIPIEVHTCEAIYIQGDQDSPATKQHAIELLTQPLPVADLVELAAREEVVQLIVIASTEAQQDHLERILQPFNSGLTLIWGVIPSLLPVTFGIISLRAVSKEQAAVEVSQHLQIPFEHILGVGDSLADWDFMRHCGFVATLENAPTELKRLVQAKGNEHGFVAPSVDENGILDVFKWFL